MGQYFLLDSITKNVLGGTKMYLKSQILSENQKCILRKALMLYLANTHRKHHNKQISDTQLTVTECNLDEIADLLHLRHVLK